MGFVHFFQLMDTKNADKKFTLMHFLVQTVQEKFPEIINFDSELRFIEKAALGRLDILLQNRAQLFKAL